MGCLSQNTGEKSLRFRQSDFLTSFRLHVATHRSLLPVDYRSSAIVTIKAQASGEQASGEPASEPSQQPARLMSGQRLQQTNCSVIGCTAQSTYVWAIGFVFIFDGNVCRKSRNVCEPLPVGLFSQPRSVQHWTDWKTVPERGIVPTVCGETAEEVTVSIFKNWCCFSLFV